MGTNIKLFVAFQVSLSFKQSFTFFFQLQSSFYFQPTVQFDKKYVLQVTGAAEIQAHNLLIQH